MAFIIQFYLGIMTLLLKVPVVLGVIHQGMAALIVLILVQIKFSIFKLRPLIDKIYSIASNKSSSEQSIHPPL